MFTFEQAFANITPLALQVYQGKQVLFVVPIQGDVPEMPDHVVTHFPDRYLHYKGQRQYVTDLIQHCKGSKFVTVTTSPVILSDAFACQVFKSIDGELKGNSFPTFGAEPGRIALHILEVEESIGSLADKTLNGFLAKDDWTVEELQQTVSQIGGGWPRAQLRELLSQKSSSVVQ